MKDVQIGSVLSNRCDIKLCSIPTFFVTVYLVLNYFLIISYFFNAQTITIKYCYYESIDIKFIYWQTMNRKFIIIDLLLELLLDQ